MSIVPPTNRSRRATLATKYARLRTVLETSSKTVEGGGKIARSEVADLQRRAIASLQECADVALRLSDCLGDAALPAGYHVPASRRLEPLRRLLRRAGQQVLRSGQQVHDRDRRQRRTRAARLEEGRLRQSNSCDAFRERAASFTDAQQRVFELLVTGLPNKLIAYEIGVSEATIKAHVSAVLRKLKVRSRAQAIALSSAFERNRNVQPTVF